MDDIIFGATNDNVQGVCYTDREGVLDEHDG